MDSWRNLNTTIFFLALLIFTSSFLVVFSFFEVEVADASSAPPRVLSYQGRLADANGDLLGGSSGTTFYFRFSIHDASTGGTRLWPSGTACSHARVAREGVFTAGIGDTAECADVLDFNFQSELFIYDD
ncbi:hypothetical protein IH970_07225 [candidate division KSB1 bacterium]|nr:hypothetical protein [candidate division KSB1 bacterium]